MKSTILFSFVFLAFFQCDAQTWEPVGGGLIAKDNVFEIGYDKDTIRNEVFALCVYNHKLYAGGMFTSAGKISASNVACWNGAKWNSLEGGTNGRVESFGIHKNLLIVGGVFDKANGKPARGIAKWVDTTHTIPSWFYFQRGLYKIVYGNDAGMQTAAYNVDAICDYKGITYIAGRYCLQQNCMDGNSGLSGWNSVKGTWEPVKSNRHDTVNLNLMSEIKALMAYKDELYIIGLAYGNYPSVRGVLVWNGKTFWQPPKFPKEYMYYECSVISDSGIYFAGNAYSSASGMYPIIRLNNDGTYKIIKCLRSGNVINSMVWYKGKLYVAGDFSSIGEIKANNIACWDGENWSALGEGFSSNKMNYPAKVRALCIYKGDLYAAGRFDHSGDTKIINIAKYSLSSVKTK